MKKEITPELIARVALVIIVVIFAGRYGVHKYQEHQRAEELISQGIYELNFSYVAVNGKTHITYMVCSPPDTDEALKTYIDQFLDKNNLVSALMERSKQFLRGAENAGMKLIFIEPTDDFPAGSELNGELLPVGNTILFINVTEVENKYTLEYHFLKGDLPNKIQKRTIVRETEEEAS